MNKSYVLQAFIGMPWAILPSKLAVLEEIVARHASGEKLSAEEIEARIHGAARPADRKVNSVAILPLFGTIFPRANLMTEMSGATSAETWGKQFAQLLDDPNIDAIVLDVNSPGGAVYGIEEVSKQIYEARGKKTIVAVANHLMASAAYWIGTAADEVVVTPSGDVGSIGVFAVHQDVSAALEEEGIKTAVISAGKYKVAGNPYQPLGDEARAVIQESVDETYDAFIDAVARNRGVKPSTVRNGFGEGRVVGARQAVELGMADRIGTLDETVNRLLGNVPAATRSAAAVTETPDARQEPASVHVHNSEARARLVSVGNRPIEGETKMLRELLKQHAGLVAQAQALVDTADGENRDLTNEERGEFNAALDAVDTIDKQIEQIEGERSRLKAAVERKFSSGSTPEKPDAKPPKTMKRADFDKLDPTVQAAYVSGGGKIED